MNLNPVKGTRDYYPEQMRKRNWLFEKFRQTARRFNFKEYDACVLEHEELYIRKSGDEITDQLYNFSDKGKRRLALRPEITPSLARMIMARRNQLSLPVRWFSIPQCFRYERMQKGRKREHFQWNMDIIGEPHLVAETELMAAVVDFCTAVGLNNQHIKIKFNNRKLFQEIFHNIGIPDNKFVETCIIIDKWAKIGDYNVKTLLLNLGIDNNMADKVINLLNAKNNTDINSINGAKPRAMAEIEELLELAKVFGINGYLVFDITVIRGLSYYTGTVFEVYDTGGQSRAICGGGRYDRLIESLGGPAIPMVGFGFGDVVISDILEERDLFPSFSQTTGYYVIAFSKAERDVAVKVISALRAAGECAELDISYKGLKKALSRANKLEFGKAIIVAPEELKKDCVVEKDLATKKERLVKIIEYFS